MTENVLVLPKNVLTNIINEKPGFHNINELDINSLIKINGIFKPRNEIEYNEYYKQVIPYVAMYRSDGKFLTLTRTTTQSEKRLHNKISLGVGGHVNTEDSKNAIDSFQLGMQREMLEEVNVILLKQPEYLGVIFDPRTSVGLVHIGIAYKVEIEFLEINEKEKFEYSWKTSKELQEMTERMEGWSVHILERL